MFLCLLRLICATAESNIIKGVSHMNFLIVVDMQNDFISGSLGSAHACSTGRNSLTISKVSSAVYFSLYSPIVLRKNGEKIGESQKIALQISRFGGLFFVFLQFPLHFCGELRENMGRNKLLIAVCCEIV